MSKKKMVLCYYVSFLAQLKLTIAKSIVELQADKIGVEQNLKADKRNQTNPYEK